MEIYSTLASVFTVISFFAFLGIVWWAYSARRKKAFEEAANEPFALPDDVEVQRTYPHPRPSPRGRGEIRGSLRDSDGNGTRS